MAYYGDSKDERTALDRNNSDDGGMFAELKDLDEESRMGFVRKVYAILAMQLLVTFGMVGMVFGLDLVQGVQDAWYMYWPCIII